MFSFFSPAALKRSFEIEDVDDIPSFSPASPPTAISPSSSHFFLNHNKANEERGGVGQSPSLSFNNNNNSLGTAAHHSCISLTSSPSPVLKSRTVVSSLSFNRGTMNKPVIHNNGSSVARAASFQSRLNPNSYSVLSGPGSDNDSLHSSTSSLEYSGSSGGGLLTKLGSYPTPPHSKPQLRQQQQEGGANHSLKKFSSHGSVFHSETDRGAGIVRGAPQPQGINHGSMPSLELQIHDGGGGIAGMHRGGGGGRMSPGHKYVNTNTNWNGHLHNTTSFGEEGHGGYRNHCQQQSPQVLKSPQPKAKETPRLNKFPLDLDSLVNITSTTSPTTAQSGSMSPNPIKPPPRSTGGLQHLSSPPFTSASPSASLSSLDSSSDTLPFSLDHLFVPFSPHSPTPSHGSIPVPELSCSPVPLSPAQSPQMEILSGPQTVQIISNLPSSRSSPRTVRSLDDGPGEARDTVGSILQRISSFSRPSVTDSPAVTQLPTVQTNGQSLAGGCLAKSTPSMKQGKKQQQGKMFFFFFTFPPTVHAD